ncbi:isoprenylcysteine carboxylmethyltransferase family protein [bacterium]|nr:isoprenylcysteine carboxylmethyltransferase family protein [bacterium]MBU1752416.1 isoprenylcysteine carboxylmethyltransferase family protein [bacterium]
MKSQAILQQIYSSLLQNRVKLSFIIFTFLLIKNFFIDKVRPHDICSFQDLWGFAGLLLVVSGVGLRSWAAGIICKCDSLATTGPYCLTRHPLYVGSLLMAIGFCFIIGDSLNLWVVLGIAFIIYFPTIHKEESFLAQKFGEEWDKYAQHTSILFPKSIPLNICSNWSLGQWLHNKEYNAFASSLVVLIVLEFLHKL